MFFYMEAIRRRNRAPHLKALLFLIGPPARPNWRRTIAIKSKHQHRVMNNAAIASDPAPTRNLLILHTPVRQDVSDWLEVKKRIEQRAPDIEVRIATNGARNSVTARWQSSRPSMVFSPYSMREYRPKSGTVYASRGFSKLDQIERLSRQDLPVPRTAKLREISHSIRRFGVGTLWPSHCAALWGEMSTSFGRVRSLRGTGR